MKSHARVVVVGGGVMGAGLLYHLALEGWTDIALIEKGELTSGSTWHAAGQCPHFNGSLNMTLSGEVEEGVAMARVALERSGDAENIGALLHGLHERGTGDTRQRVMWSSAKSPAGFARALADATLAGCAD